MRQERLQRMVQLLKTHRVVPRQTFLERFEISPATFKRDLEYLRDRLGAPVIWDRERRGYRFDLSDTEAETFEMPGLWFNSQEIHALLTMHQLIDELQPSLLTPHIEPLKERIESLLEGEEHTSDEVRKLSPQRLIFYRDNWYLDAWCHLRKGVRSFSVETLRKAVPLDKKARKVAEKTLNEMLASGYGIFGGRDTQTARLRFTPERARWVATETWHPQQKGRFDDDGSYVLEFPYSDDRELIMDILKHGPAVEVISPAPLRKRIQEQAAATIRQYR